MQRLLILLIAAASLCGIAHTQDSDSQSLGDVARQVRLQKQKDAHGKGIPAKPAVTEDENTSSSDSAATSDHAVTVKENAEPSVSTNSQSNRSTPTNAGPSAKTGDKEAQGEQWRSQIQQQKSEIASMQQQIDSLSSSIQYAPGNCVANCVKWNEHQDKKQEQVDSMKSQLEEMQHHLEEMQDTARKEGFGSSIYDP